MYTGNKKLKTALFNAFTDIDYIVLEGDVDDFIKSLEDGGYLIVEKGIKIPLINNKLNN